MGINDQGKKSLTDKRDVYGVSTALVTMLFLALEPAEGLKAVRCSDVPVMKEPEQYFREEKQPEKNRETTTDYCPWFCWLPGAVTQQ